jgi:hypothetical protein
MKLLEGYANKIGKSMSYAKLFREVKELVIVRIIYHILRLKRTKKR